MASQGKAEGLYGFERLKKVVDQVTKPTSNGGTHFCERTTSKQLLNFIRGELDEVEQELEKCASHPNSVRDLASELGDVLFDTLLLVSKCSRDFSSESLSLNSVAHAAALKVERRCPYVFKGDSSTKLPSLEAERIAWRAAKEKEKCERE